MIAYTFSTRVEFVTFGTIYNRFDTVYSFEGHTEMYWVCTFGTDVTHYKVGTETGC
jgi:hypothetical protein